jgi:hypothetical protein
MPVELKESLFTGSSKAFVSIWTDDGIVDGGTVRIISSKESVRLSGINIRHQKYFFRELDVLTCSLIV